MNTDWILSLISTFSVCLYFFLLFPVFLPVAFIVFHVSFIILSFIFTFFLFLFSLSLFLSSIFSLFLHRFPLFPFLCHLLPFIFFLCHLFPVFLPVELLLCPVSFIFVSFSFSVSCYFLSFFPLLICFVSLPSLTFSCINFLFSLPFLFSFLF